MTQRSHETILKPTTPFLCVSSLNDMVRNLHATTAAGLRKNRVTQKTRLRVVRGELDDEAILIDDEEERNRVVASQGVDAEDANVSCSLGRGTWSIAIGWRSLNCIPRMADSCMTIGAPSPGGPQCC